MIREFLTDTLSDGGVLASVIFIAARSLALIIPPIPGWFIDVIGIAVFGWSKGFILAVTASMIGTTISFYIARRWREPLVRRFVALQKLHAWEAQFSEKQKFFGIVFLRIAFAPVFDYMSYAAGLTGISTARFLLASFTASVALIAPYYYLGSVAYDFGLIYLILFVVAVISGTTLIAKKKFQKKGLENLLP